MTPLGTCEFCGREVPDGPAAYPITGWEVTRHRGGANRILDRERAPGRVAHAYCAEWAAKRKREGLVNQGALL